MKPMKKRLTQINENDLRDEIFKNVMNKQATATISLEDDGIVCGIEHLKRRAISLGLKVDKTAKDGSHIRRGGIVARVRGNPKQIAIGEDALIGLIAKTSGIATAASKAVELSNGRFKIVSGAWKKMPPAIKDKVREALTIAGVGVRIVDERFVYLDKNYVRLLGGISEALLAVNKMRNRTKVVQLKGETCDIAQEAVEATNYGAQVIVIDTGKRSDIKSVVTVLNRIGIRGQVRIGFAGNVEINDIRKFRDSGIDILEIGRAIIDAPLLDMKMNVN